MKITESKIKLIIENVINEISLLNESGGFKGLNNNPQGIKSRDGSIGHRTGGDGMFKDIPQTNDINIIDLGRPSKEKLEQWDKMHRKPSERYYSNPNHLTAHIRHLQHLYGSRIKFYSYIGGYIFYDLDGKKGYLTDAALSGY